MLQNSTSNFKPSASSKVDYKIIFMLAWKAVRHSRNGLLILQRFLNHIQELVQFGALFTKQCSKSTSNIKPRKLKIPSSYHCAV